MNQAPLLMRYELFFLYIEIRQKEIHFKWWSQFRFRRVPKIYPVIPFREKKFMIMLAISLGNGSCGSLKWKSKLKDRMKEIIRRNLNPFSSSIGSFWLWNANRQCQLYWNWRKWSNVRIAGVETGLLINWKVIVLLGKEREKNLCEKD